jgi:hypothetical protein
MAPKRKPADSQNEIVPSTLKRPRISQPLATKAPRKAAPSGKSKIAEAARTATSSLLQTRPWLQRPQPVSRQDLFILHCRDNLVSGATGPKDWHVLTEEFNARFKDDLKKPLAYNTLSKRCGAARKKFLTNNPEYVGLCVYPVPQIESEAEKEPKDSEMIEPVEEEEVSEGDTEEQEALELPNDETMNLQEEPAAHLPETPIAIQQANKMPTPLPSSSPARSNPAFTAIITNTLPGSYNPSAVQEDYIPPTTRAKFHLQRRTDKRITFQFTNADEHDPADECAQYIDTNTLISTSPFYARVAEEDPRDTVILVPDYISIRTVNIFIQLVSPGRANELPTHYLWKSKKPVPGVYDRYGAIKVEKIIWTVDTLLDLLLFGQWTEVYWIVDMVIDRLHFLFTEETRHADIFADMEKPVDGFANVGGRQVYVGSKLPAVDNTLARVTVEDLDEDFLSTLNDLSAGAPVWTFFADMLYALGEEAKSAKWFPAMSKQVRQILFRPDDSFLDVVTSREEFCARYHHHGSDTDACYTSHRVHSASYYIDALYASSNPKELVSRSEGLESANNLASITYSSTGDVSKLKRDNSTPQMLETEKMVLDMESRLYEAKRTMLRAREATEGAKQATTEEASRIAQAMYGCEAFRKEL